MEIPVHEKQGNGSDTKDIFLLAITVKSDMLERQENKEGLSNERR